MTERDSAHDMARLKGTHKADLDATQWVVPVSERINTALEIIDIIEACSYGRSEHLNPAKIGDSFMFVRSALNDVLSLVSAAHLLTANNIHDSGAGTGN